MFSFTFSIITWLLLALLPCTAIIAVFFAGRPLWRVAKMPYTQPDEDYTECAKASVILYSSQPEEQLIESIDSLLTQDYPDYELIVVYNASAETTKNLASLLEGRKDRVYLTFIPPGSRNLSRLKLALTLGMKAAHGEVAVITSTNAEIPSIHWLSDMMAHFNNVERADVVLGYSHIRLDELNGLGKWYRQFDSVMTDTQWIGAALDGHPFRGDRNNLAFRRSIFFQHKGYASTMFLQNGDDDLFVNEICQGRLAVVQLSPDTILTMNWGESANRISTDIKERHLFTQRWLPNGPFMRGSLFSFCQWLCPAAAVAAALTALPSIIPSIIAATVLMLFWLAEIIIYRKAAGKLQEMRLWWAVVPFMMLRPIINFIFRTAVYSRRSKNYTWQRKRI